MKQSICRLIKQTRSIRRIVRDKRGTAVLEMAIMTPVLLSIGLGVMELGNLVYKRHMIENGIRDAARYMAGIPDCNDNKQVGADLATHGTIDGTGPARVANWELEAIDISCANVTTSDDLTTLKPFVSVVRIDATVTYADIDLGFLDVLANLGADLTTLTFPVQHEERWYGER